MRTQITLYGADSEWFDEIRKRVADRRGGTEPSNAELVRLMMQNYEVKREPESPKL